MYGTQAHALPAAPPASQASTAGMGGQVGVGVERAYHEWMI